MPLKSPYKNISDEDYTKMTKGICPICGMKKHSKTRALICEAKFREKINQPEPELRINGKVYHADARFITKEEAERMKKNGKQSL